MINFATRRRLLGRQLEYRATVNKTHGTVNHGGREQSEKEIVLSREIEDKAT